MAFSGFSTNKPANSLFGASTTAQPTGSLFGNTATQQNQPQQGTSIFGGSTLGQQNQATGTTGGTGLFSNTQNQQTGQSGSTGPSLFGLGAFGQPQNQQQQQQNAGQSSTSNFFSQPPGQQGQQQQQQPNASTSLFDGASLNTNTTGTQQQNTFGGFGSNTNATNTNTNTNTSSLFGQGLQRQATLPAFGGSTTNSLFKQPSQQPTLNFSAVQQSGAPPFVKSTKFNDLPDEIKRALESIDALIQSKIQISNELKQRKVGEEEAKGKEMIYAVHKDLVGAITTLQSDIHHTRDLTVKTDQTVQDTIVATRIIDGFRNPQQNGIYLRNHAAFPLEFFQRVMEDMRNRLRWYKTTIEQIERKLSSTAVQTQATPHAIASTLQAQHATFVALASKAASLDAELQKVKALYTQLWRAKTGSMRDPFNELDRGTGTEFGLESLSGK